MSTGVIARGSGLTSFLAGKMQEATRYAIADLDVPDWKSQAVQAESLRRMSSDVSSGRSTTVHQTVLNTWIDKWLQGEWHPSNSSETSALCNQVGFLLQKKQSLIEPLTALIESGTLGRRNWLALLSGYWSGDFADNPTWRKSELRQILTTHFNLLVNDGSNEPTRWQVAVKNAKDLLAENADTDFFVNHPMSRQEAIELLRSMYVDANSWLYRSLILRDLLELSKLPKAEFDAGLTEAIQNLTLHQTKVNLFKAGLKILLERCAKEPGYPLVEGLKTAALANLGHPSVFGNQWDVEGLSQAAKSMVLRWISKWDLEQFFGLLETHGDANKDRLRFWKQHLDKMSGTQIVFGVQAHDNSRSDFRTLRELLKTEKRYCRMIDGSSDNNAFVFQLKGHVFVEFGIHGKGACYVYPQDELPPGMINFQGRPPSQISESTLKSLTNGNKNRWVHSGDWQSNFNDRIWSLPIPKSELSESSGSKFGYGSSSPTPTISGSGNPPNASSNLPKTTIHSLLTKSIQTDSELSLFRNWAAQNRVQLNDHRLKGGALWASTMDASSVKILEQMGFRYVATRDSYFLN